MNIKNVLLGSLALFAVSSNATRLPISGGSAEGIALCKDNKVVAWGQNYNSNSKRINILSLDTTIAEFEEKKFYSTPQQVNTNGIKFTQVETGSGFTFLGISDKGVLYVWGQCVEPDTLLLQPTPVKCGEGMLGYNEDGTIGGIYIGNVKKVEGSTTGAIALLNDGTAIFTDRFTDITIENYVTDKSDTKINNIIDICAGDDSYFALTSEGLLYGAGSYNGYSEQLEEKFGLVLLEETKEPLKNVVACGSGDVCSFAITKDGRAYGWGNGGWGGCTGLGKTLSNIYASPIVAGDYAAINKRDYLNNVKRIDGGRAYGMAVTYDGYVLYWGNNDSNGGVIGSADKDYSFPSPKFLIYEDGTVVNDAVEIECGDNFGFVVNKKNQYFSFGLNDMGQCGVGSDKKTINYLHPLTFDCELNAPCPTVHLVGDTIQTCDNNFSITALTSSVLDNKDFTLSWYINGTKNNVESNICESFVKGSYKVLLTPTDNQCPTSEDSIFLKFIDPLVQNLESKTTLTKLEDLEETGLFFKMKTASTNVEYFSDEACSKEIKKYKIYNGTIQVASSDATINGPVASIWARAKENTTLLPENSLIDYTFNNVINHGLLLETEKIATLHSFKIKLKNYLPNQESVASITPILYKVKSGLTPSIKTELVNEGKTQIFIIKDTSECLVICDFTIPNNGMYMLSMNIDYDGVASLKKTTGQTEDINNYGIKYIGNTVAAGILNTQSFYYDLYFSEVKNNPCGATELTSNIELVKKYHIELTTDNEERGNVIGSGDYMSGDTITLKAVAKYGYKFQFWEDINGNTYKENPYELVITSDTVLKAVFNGDSHCTVTTSVNDENGGEVSGAGQFLFGSAVKLIAKPAEGYRFIGWTYENAIEPTLIFTANVDSIHVEALFDKIKDKTIDENGLSLVWQEDFGTAFSENGYWTWNYSDLNNPIKVFHYDAKNWQHSSQVEPTGAILSIPVYEEGTYCVASNVTSLLNLDKTGTLFGWQAMFGNGKYPSDNGWEMVPDHTYNGEDYGGMLYLNCGNKAEETILSYTVSGLTKEREYLARCYINNFSIAIEPVKIKIKVTDLESGDVSISDIVTRNSNDELVDWKEVSTSIFATGTQLKIDIISVLGGIDINSKGNDLVLDDIQLLEVSKGTSADKISIVESNNSIAPNEIFDIYGRKIENMVPNKVYIKKGKKFLFKN